MNPDLSSRSPSAAPGFSLVEMLVTVAVLGLLSLLAIFSISRIHDQSDATKDRANARHIAQISSALGAMGVAHVLPDSLGGAEATARLLRQGVQVAEGPFAGQTISIKALSDTEIRSAVRYLDLIYDLREMRLEYNPGKSANLTLITSSFATLALWPPTLSLPAPLL